MFQKLTINLWSYSLLMVFAAIGLYFVALTTGVANLIHFSL